MHLLADLEEGHALVFNADGFAGARVAAGAGLALLDRESAEATQLDACAGGECLWLFPRKPCRRSVQRGSGRDVD